MDKRSGFAARELYAVVLLAVMNLFLFADQNLMAPNLTQIARDLGLNDVQRDVMLGGDISAVFFVLGSLVTLAIGYFTDRVSRKKLFIAVIILGEIPCLLTGFVKTYDQLFWMRALTGIGIGGALPLTYSMIGDYFSHGNRAMATAWISLAEGLGIAAGQLLAGFIGPSMGWRLPFIIVALPNFALCLLFLLSVREPGRGRTEDALRDLIQSGAVYTGRIDWRKYRELFRIKTNIMVFLQGIPGTVPWGVFFIFLNDFYSQDKGYSVEVATLIVMVLGAAAILGSFVGGLIGNKLYNIKPKFLPLLCGTSTLLGIIPVALLLNYPSQAGVANPDITGPLVLGLMAGFMISLTGPNVKAMLLNVNAPETRGSIFSLFNLTDNLGKGFGPVIISIFIVQFGRVYAFNIANLFWVICGLVLLAMALTFPKDEIALTEAMKEKATDMAASVRS